MPKSQLPKHVYIASPFFTNEEIQFVTEVEKSLSSIGIEYYSPMREGILKPDAPEDEQIRLYTSNIGAIEERPLMVANIDDRDPGTLFEMGYAAALGKLIITITRHNYNVNVMLARSVLAHTRTISDMNEVISKVVKLRDGGDSYDYIKELQLIRDKFGFKGPVF